MQQTNCRIPEKNEYFFFFFGDITWSNSQFVLENRNENNITVLPAKAWVLWPACTMSGRKMTLKLVSDAPQSSHNGEALGTIAPNSYHGGKALPAFFHLTREKSLNVVSLAFTGCENVETELGYTSTS